MSLQTRLYLSNEGGDSVIFCIQVDSVCTADVLSTCSVEDVMVVGPGEIQIKDVNGDNKSFICISAWSGSVPNTGVAPSGSESIQISSSVLAIEVSWDGTSLSLEDYCTLTSFTENPNSAVSIYLNSISSTSALVCTSASRNITDCNDWTFNDNPCINASSGTSSILGDLAELPPASVIKIDQVAGSGDTICVGVWGSSSSGGTPSAGDTPSMETILVDDYLTGADLRWTGLRLLKTETWYECGAILNPIPATPSSSDNVGNFITKWWFLFFLLLAGVATIIVLFIYMHSPPQPSFPEITE